MEDDFNSCIEEPSLDLEPRDSLSPSKIIFTSGTTSQPKAVILSLKNIFSGYESLKRRCPLTEEDVCYLFLPLTHTYGCIYNFIFSLLNTHIHTIPLCIYITKNSDCITQSKYKTIDSINEQLRGMVSCSPMKAICERRYLTNGELVSHEFSTVTFTTKRKRARIGNRKLCLATL